MVVAYGVFGIVGGAIGFIGALILGYSLWWTFLSYSLVGSITCLLVPLLRMTEGRLPAFADMDEEYESIETPVAQRGAVDEPLAIAPRAPALTVKILAVDDEPFILELIPKIAAKIGFLEVTTVSSGALAMDAIARADTPFDCVLLDINMPGMNGIDLCARIRQTDGYDSASIIMLTAMSDIDHIERAFLAGATDYTSKPFDIMEFGERLQSAQAWTTVRRAAPRGDGLPTVSGDTSRRNFRASKLLPGLVKVPLLINEGALQNYLARLPSSALANAYVMTIVLQGVGQPVDELPSVDHLTLLTRVAAAIDDVFKSDGYVMAYADEGRFVVASHALSLPIAHTVEAAIADRLVIERIDTVSELGDTPQIFVGSAVRPGGRNAQRARMALDTSIHLAEARAAQKTGPLKSISAINA